MKQTILDNYLEKFGWLSGWLLLAMMLILFLGVLVHPAQAAEINPSVDTQPAICRNVFTGWICDLSKPGATGTQGPHGLPGQDNFSAIFNSPQNFTSYQNISMFYNVTNSTINSNYTVYQGGTFYNGSINESYAYLLGRPNGQALYGSSTTGGLILRGNTSNTGWVLINPEATAGSAGSVGIGTTTPIDQVEIKNTNSGADSRASIRLGTGNALIRMFVTGISHPSNIGLFDMDTTTRDNVTAIYTSSTKPFYLGTYLSSPIKLGTNNLVRLSINESGNIGVRTTTPTREFEILQQSTTPALNIIERSKTNRRATMGFGLDIGTTSGWAIGQSSGYNTVKDFYIYDASNSAIRMHIYPSGIMRFPQYGAGTATFDAGGNITSVSDEKFKTNILPLKTNNKAPTTTSIQKIMALNPVCWNYNALSGLDTNNKYCGFIAQDVEKIIPEAVYTRDDVRYDTIKTKTKEGFEEDKTVEVKLGTQTKTIDERGIIDTIVLAMQEQQTTIEEQQKTIDELKTRLDKAGIA